MCFFSADIRMQNARRSAAAHARASGCAAAEVISEDVVAALHDLVRESERDEKRGTMIRKIKQDPKLIDATNKDGDTAMHVAARAGFLRTVSVLVELSAIYQRGCMYKTNKDGNNPLHLALMYGHDPVARFLQQKYPLKVWLKLNLEGISPIYLAIVDRYWDLVKDVLQCEGFIKAMFVFMFWGPDMDFVSDPIRIRRLVALCFPGFGIPNFPNTPIDHVLEIPSHPRFFSYPPHLLYLSASPLPLRLTSASPPRPLRLVSVVNRSTHRNSSLSKCDEQLRRSPSDQHTMESVNISLDFPKSLPDYHFDLFFIVFVGFDCFCVD